MRGVLHLPSCSEAPAARSSRARPPRRASRRLRTLPPAGHGLTGAGRQECLEQQTPEVFTSNTHSMGVGCGPSAP